MIYVIEKDEDNVRLLGTIRKVVSKQTCPEQRAGSFFYVYLFLFYIKILEKALKKNEFLTDFENRILSDFHYVLLLKKNSSRMAGKAPQKLSRSVYQV